MEPISKQSLTKLMNQLALVQAELRRKEPVLMREQDLLMEAIRTFDSTEKPYASVKWPKTAIPLCLERNKAWMTREQIKRDLEEGGFVFDPRVFPQLLAAALRYHARKGTLVRVDSDGSQIHYGTYKAHTRFADERFGLPEWLKDDKIPLLEEKQQI